MIIPHDSNDLIVMIPKGQISRIFSAVTNNISALKALYQSFTSCQDGSADEDELLEDIDDNPLTDVDYLMQMAKFRPSLMDPLNSYFLRTASTFECLQHDLETIQLMGEIPDEAALDCVKKRIYDVLSGFLFFLCYEFKLLDTYKTKELVDETTYQIIGKAAVSASDAVSKCVEFAGNMIHDTSVYKLCLRVFDDYPEKEDEFMSIVGPAYGNIDSDKLTIKIVDSVCDGSMSVEDLLLNCSYDDDINADSAPVDKKAFAEAAVIHAF